MVHHSQIAAAPISWGVCEVPGWGHQMASARVLEEARSVGLQATEKGPPGFLPDEPHLLRDALDASTLSLVGGFVAVVLHASRFSWRTEVESAARTFAGAGGDVVVLAAAAATEGYEQLQELSPDQWACLLANLDEAAEMITAYGLVPALHPHVGTVVERPEHTARVLEEASIPMCVDTGHVMAGGGDPLALVRAAPERVSHVHVKDVDAELAARVAAHEAGYQEAVSCGLYRAVGDGDVPMADIVALLEDVGYRGWYVLEQDRVLEREPPPGEGPVEDVRRSAQALLAMGATHPQSPPATRAHNENPVPSQKEPTWRSARDR